MTWNLFRDHWISHSLIMVKIMLIMLKLFLNTIIFIVNVSVPLYHQKFSSKLRIFFKTFYRYWKNFQHSKLYDCPTQPSKLIFFYFATLSIFYYVFLVLIFNLSWTSQTHNIMSFLIIFTNHIKSHKYFTYAICNNQAIHIILKYINISL